MRRLEFRGEKFYRRKTSVTPKPAIIIKADGRTISVAMVCPREKSARGMPFSEDLRDELEIDRDRRSIKQADNRLESFINHRPR